MVMVILSAHQRQVRDEAAHARARRRDHPDRHQRAAPRFIRFVDADVAHAGVGESARSSAGEAASATAVAGGAAAAASGNCADQPAAWIVCASWTPVGTSSRTIT
jgi:hypothetical protein